MEEIGTFIMLAIAVWFAYEATKPKKDPVKEIKKIIEKKYKK